MSIDIIRYTDDMESMWDDFVWNSNTGTLFHTRRFLSYHPKDRFVDSSLLFKKNGRILALFPAIDFEENGQRILYSHRGASYGGMVNNDTLSIHEAFEVIHAMVQYARNEGFHIIDTTPPPQIYFRRPSNYMDFAMLQNEFQFRKFEISSVIPLDFPRQDILSTFNEGSRRAVRRGQKLGIQVRESDDLHDYQTFYHILQKNLRLRHGVNPTHSLEEILILKGMFPERIKLFAAFTPDNDMAAGVVMFICNPRVVLAFYISHDEAYQQYRGVNCLFYDIIDWGIQKDYGFLDFGIFTVNEEPNWGLARFKESFGAQGVFRYSLRLMI